jgi:hypothetical protein
VGLLVEVKRESSEFMTHLSHREEIDLPDPVSSSIFRPPRSPLPG